MTEKYNGWRNYETWATGLWLTNDQASYTALRELIETAKKDAKTCWQVKEGIWKEQEASRFIAEDRLKEQVEGGSPLTEGSLYSDLLNAALQEVSWREIVTNHWES